MSDSTGSLPFRPREDGEQKKHRGTSKRPNRQTRRNDAHTVSRLSKHLDSSLASDTIFHSGLSGDTHVLTNYDASCSTGESQASKEAHLRNDLGLQPVWSPSANDKVASTSDHDFEDHLVPIEVTCWLNDKQIGTQKTFGAMECTTLTKFKNMVMLWFAAEFRVCKVTADVLFNGLNLYSPFMKDYFPGVYTPRMYQQWFESDVRTAPFGALCHIQVMLVKPGWGNDDSVRDCAFWFNNAQREYRNPADGIDGVKIFFEEFAAGDLLQQEEAEKDPEGHFWKTYRKYEAAYFKMQKLGVILSDGSDGEEEPAAISTRKDGRRAYGGLRVPGY